MSIIIFNQLQILRWHRTTLSCQALLPPSNSNSIISTWALKSKKPTETSTILNPLNMYYPDKSHSLSPHPSPKRSCQLLMTTSTPRILVKLLSSTSPTGSDSIGMCLGSMDTSKSRLYKVMRKMPGIEKSKSLSIFKTTPYPLTKKSNRTPASLKANSSKDKSA